MRGAKKYIEFHVPTFSLEVPKGWAVAESTVTKSKVTFSVRGIPELLQTPVTIIAKAGEETFCTNVPLGTFRGRSGVIIDRLDKPGRNRRTCRLVRRSGRGRRASRRR